MSENSPSISVELYALVGEFTVEFEWFCFFLRNTIRHLAGLMGNKNEMIIKALTTDMNAIPLLKAYHSIAMSMRELTKDEEILLSKIYKQVKELIERRNNLIHSTWFTPLQSDGDMTQAWATGLKERHTKTGVDRKYFKLSVDDFRPFINECNNASGVITMVALAFSESSLTPWFVSDSNGLISINPDRPKMKPDLLAEEAAAQKSGAPSVPPV